MDDKLTMMTDRPTDGRTDNRYVYILIIIKYVLLVVSFVVGRFKRVI